MMTYKILEEVEILGEVRIIGSKIELDEEAAAPFVAENKLELVIEESTTPTPESSEKGEDTPVV